jgi:hypothetical protein
MAKENNNTIVYAKQFIQFDKYRKRALNKFLNACSIRIMKKKSLYEIAEFCFRAGYYHGAIETTEDKKLFNAVSTMKVDVEEETEE